MYMLYVCQGMDRLVIQNSEVACFHFEQIISNKFHILLIMIDINIYKTINHDRNSMSLIFHLGHAEPGYIPIKQYRS